MGTIVALSLVTALGGTYLGIIYLIEGKMLWAKVSIGGPWAFFVIAIIVLAIRGKISPKSERANQTVSLSMDDLWKMDPYQFEKFIERMYERKGYKASRTSGSNDKGADIIAIGKKSGYQLVVQVKHHQNKIGTTAVQEVVGARDFYNADKAVLIASSGLTKPAKRYADKTEVLLVERERLLELTNKHFDSQDDLLG